MGLFGIYSYQNKKGKTYYLHKTVGKNDTLLYFFSKSPRNAIDLPSGKTVIENPQTGLPLIKNLGTTAKK